MHDDEDRQRDDPDHRMKPSFQHRAQYTLGVRSRAFVFAVSGLLAALGSMGACSGAQKSAVPVATLPSTPEAALAFANIHEAWEQRQVERGALFEFVKRYPED